MNYPPAFEPVLWISSMRYQWTQPPLGSLVRPPSLQLLSSPPPWASASPPGSLTRAGSSCWILPPAIETGPEGRSGRRRGLFQTEHLSFWTKFAGNNCTCADGQCWRMRQRAQVLRFSSGRKLGFQSRYRQLEVLLFQSEGLLQNNV